MSPQPERPPLVLASSSPRRAELLRAAGYDFRVVPSPVDDDGPMPSGLSAAQIAEERSRQKAVAVAALLDRQPGSATPRGEWVLGADTVVAVADRLLGKPSDRADAETMLATLAGRPHTVATGVTLIRPTGAVVTRSATAVVQLAALPPGRLTAYLDSGLWRGKAGAYGYQDRAVAGLELTLLAGEAGTVIGLPMELLAAMLAEPA